MISACDDLLTGASEPRGGIYGENLKIAVGPLGFFAAFKHLFRQTSAPDPVSVDEPNRSPVYVCADHS